MLTEELKKEINAMSYREMLSRWRFTAFGDELFSGEVGKYFSEVMKMKEQQLDPMEKVMISKTIGW